MKLSTKTRYGLRALLYMARAYDGESTIPVGEIAREQGVSEKYLEQLFLRLRRSGLIRSVRGAQGGYMLCNPPEDVTVAEVVDSLEGDITFADCLTSEGCANRDTCPTHELWSRLKGSIDDILEDTTLADLIRSESDGPEEERHPGG
ncbi:MAG: Rrf2 family transcriptional regulator [Synergistaceae bacterium]|nr:Rrf2 family transcriptional regulator [Synergistaceae bacterium]